MGSGQKKVPGDCGFCLTAHSNSPTLSREGAALPSPGEEEEFETLKQLKT